MRYQLSPAGDPPPTNTPVPPDPGKPERDRDDIPDTPGSEPPPVPMQDPRPDTAPVGPMIS